MERRVLEVMYLYLDCRDQGRFFSHCRDRPRRRRRVTRSTRRVAAGVPSHRSHQRLRAESLAARAHRAEVAVEE